MTTYALGTESVHRSAELCDYLRERIDAGDTVHAVNSRVRGGFGEADELVVGL